jgi:hypothetical protein
MVDVLARAVRAHERAPRAGIELGAGRFRLVVDHARLRAIVATARRRSTTHNGGRPLVERLLRRALEEAYRDRLERDLRIGRIGPEAVEYAPPLLDVVDREALARAVHTVWPRLGAEDLLRRLLASPRRLASAGRDILTPDEIDVLHASSQLGDGWSEADVALLDEADLLLGTVPPRRQRSPGRRRSLDHVADRILAERLPDCPRCGRPLEYLPGEASGRDRLDCRECKATYATTTLMGDPAANELHGVYEELAHQFDVEEAPASVRPADARYGHVVVDEAQDLSPMQWRAVARRCPTRSFTLAGDEAQAVRAGAAATWDRILAALGAEADTGHGSVARHELTVNYRTPAEVMELAARLLEQFAPHLHPARSVRTAGVGPRRLHTGGRALGAADVESAVARLRRDVADGLVAVVAPEQARAQLAAAERNGSAEHLTAVDAKGLEFDGVVVADPEAIVRESPGATGMARLYVALTRATTRLTILAPTPPGPPLDDALGRFEPTR